MDTAGAILQGVGMLSIAYYLGYPLAWAAAKADRLVSRFSPKSASWEQFNALLWQALSN